MKGTNGHLVTPTRFRERGVLFQNTNRLKPGEPRGSSSSSQVFLTVVGNPLPSLASLLMVATPVTGPVAPISPHARELCQRSAPLPAAAPAAAQVGEPGGRGSHRSLQSGPVEAIPGQSGQLGDLLTAGGRDAELRPHGSERTEDPARSCQAPSVGLSPVVTGSGESCGPPACFSDDCRYLRNDVQSESMSSTGAP